MSKKELEQITKAKRMIGQLGVRSAAGYLRNRGWHLKDAMWILLGVNIPVTDAARWTPKKIR